MSSFHLPTYRRYQRETADKKPANKVLTPWTVMNFILEVCQNHLLSNDPKTMGYAFEQRYSPNRTESSIYTDINNNWKTTEVQMRPAVFVSRGAATVQGNPTIGQTIGTDVPEAEEHRLTLLSMPCSVVTICNGVGFAEIFAEYMRYPFLYFAKEIEQEYCLQRLRVISIGEPQPFTVDAKDSFSVELRLEIEFFDKWSVKADTLKLKTVSMHADIVEE